MSYQHFPGTQHGPGNSAQRYLQPAAPGRVRLAGIRTDVDVNESLADGTLHKRPGEVWQVVFARLCRDSEFEFEIVALRSLLGDEIEGTSLPFLQSKVHPRTWSLQDDAQRNCCWFVLRQKTFRRARLLIDAPNSSVDFR